MRFSDLPLSVTSIASTAALAAALGAATMLWPAQDRPSDMMPVIFEEITITADAPEEPAVVAVLDAPGRSFAAGQPVTVQARIENRGTEPVVVSAAGPYDLAVQRTASPQPMSGGDVMFLSLAQAGDQDSVVLKPGQSVTRVLDLGTEQPFDRPGTYRVTGSWLGADAPAYLPAFEVVVDEPATLAQKDAARPVPGA